MPLIETDAANPTSFGMGTFAPHADQTKFRSLWACVDGKNDGRWPSVRQAEEGMPVGNNGRMRLPYKAHKGGEKNSAFHDITFGEVKLREMVVPIEDAMEKDKYEGALSSEQVSRFESNLAEKRETLEGLTKTTSLESTIEVHQ
jgi:hypothetical protein